MTKQKVQEFRFEFQNSVKQLEKDFGVRISLGTIRFDESGLRAKMEAVKGDTVDVFTKDDFRIGEIVTINHPKVDKRSKFAIVKISSKNILVEQLDGNIEGVIGVPFQRSRVSPSLLVKTEK